MFQTQTLKCGEVDVSCKDYLFSWGMKFARVETRYTPDLHSDFGVERHSGKKIRLPTPTWPFDHAGVAVRFEPAGTGPASRVRISPARVLLRFLQVVFLLAIVLCLAWPVVVIAVDECYVTGHEEAGLWDIPDAIVEAVSVCEAPAPCRDGSWTVGEPRPPVEDDTGSRGGNATGKALSQDGPCNSRIQIHFWCTLRMDSGRLLEQCAQFLLLSSRSCKAPGTTSSC